MFDRNKIALLVTVAAVSVPLVAVGLLSDSEWPRALFPRHEAKLVDRLTAAPPSESIRFAVHDSVLRLLVGKDDGDGTMSGFLETQVVPGDKVCEVYYSDEAQVVVVRPAEPAPAPDF